MPLKWKLAMENIKKKISEFEGPSQVPLVRASKWGRRKWIDLLPSLGVSQLRVQHSRSQVQSPCPILLGDGGPRSHHAGGKQCTNIDCHSSTRSHQQEELRELDLANPGSVRQNTAMRMRDIESHCREAEQWRSASEEDGRKDERGGRHTQRKQ